jgi:zinc D-Ala-D-Ala dipeptidase
VITTHQVLSHDLAITVPAAAAVTTPAPVDESRVPIVECGEPLVPLDDAFTCLNLYAVDGWAGTVPVTYVRAAVRERLLDAQDSLPAGWALAIFDAWRSPETVRALYDHFYGPGTTLPPGFLADPDDPDVVPPHTTGAAVDLTLAVEGHALALGTYFDDFTAAAHLDAYERPGRDPTARDLRRVLHAAMTGAGFAPNPTEWWHWSHGDQAWAARADARTARFGPTRPSAH